MNNQIAVTDIVIGTRILVSNVPRTVATVTTEIVNTPFGNNEHVVLTFSKTQNDFIRDLKGSVSYLKTAKVVNVS